MKKNKLFVGGLITLIFGLLGFIIGVSDLNVELLFFYGATICIGLGLLLLDKDKKTNQAMPVQDYNVSNGVFSQHCTRNTLNKRVKKWVIPFALAGVLLILFFAVENNNTDSEKMYSSELPTEITSEKFTKTPTDKITEPVTELNTEQPTEPSTENKTEKPTEISTEVITQKPTELPTETPTEVFTEQETSLLSEDTSDSYSDTNAEQEQQSNYTYVLNTSTMKVHEPGCRFVKKINSENIDYTYDLEQALSSGYSSCKVCNP